MTAHVPEVQRIAVLEVPKADLLQLPVLPHARVLAVEVDHFRDRVRILVEHPDLPGVWAGASAPLTDVGTLAKAPQARRPPIAPGQ